jgi:glutaconate CoA-transferase subunit B
MTPHDDQQQFAGPLFSSPDCDAAREYFRAKPKGMTDKVLSVADAVSRFVDDGDYLASGGFGGDHQQPEVRLPGSGIANDLGPLCWRVLVITPHDRRRFTERVDFITTPGFLDGPGAREKADLPPGTGPYKVITNLAVMGFNEEAKRMQVESLRPNVTLDEVRANTGFELLVKEPLELTPTPDDEQLRVLREDVDPHRYIIGRG